MTCVVPSGVAPVTCLWADRKRRTLGSGPAGSAGQSCTLSPFKTAEGQLSDKRPARANCCRTTVLQLAFASFPPSKSAAGQLSCSCPVEPFALVDVLHDSCPRCVLQESFQQESPATVGHAATRTRMRAAGDTHYAISRKADREGRQRRKT